MTETCATCRHFHGPPRGWGQCRRRAPVITPLSNTAWPEIHSGDRGCGEWEHVSLLRVIERKAEETEMVG